MSEDIFECEGCAKEISESDKKRMEVLSFDKKESPFALDFCKWQCMQEYYRKTEVK